MNNLRRTVECEQNLQLAPIHVLNVDLSFTPFVEKLLIKRMKGLVVQLYVTYAVVEKTLILHEKVRRRG